MPQEPKRRHSKERKGKRRASIRLELPTVSICPNCGAEKMPHIVCRECGMYKGKKVI